MKKSTITILAIGLLVYSCKKEGEPQSKDNLNIEIACPIQRCIVVVDTTSHKYGQGKLDYGTYQRRMLQYYAEKNDQLSVKVQAADLHSIIQMRVKIIYKGKVLDEFNGESVDYLYQNRFEY
jgi:hypothetical protein